MDRDFIKKAVLIPVITGLVIGVLFAVAFGTTVNGMMPFNEGAQLAVHGLLTVDEAPEAASVREAAKNSRLGITVNGRELVKDADYTLLKDCVSVRTGSNEFTGTGCRYLKTIYGVADKFTQTLTLSHSDGTKQHFVFADKYTVSNEQEALAVAPLFDSSIVVYYQNREGAGLSSDYYVMIYEEVA